MYLSFIYKYGFFGNDLNFHLYFFILLSIGDLGLFLNKITSPMEYFKNPNLQNVIGNIRNKDRVKTALTNIKPSIVIIAAALKHIDRC